MKALVSLQEWAPLSGYCETSPEYLKVSSVSALWLANHLSKPTQSWDCTEIRNSPTVQTNSGLYNQLQVSPLRQSNPSRTMERWLVNQHSRELRGDTYELARIQISNNKPVYVLFTLV